MSSTQPNTTTRQQVPISEMFRALSHRNYKLFFIGQGVSLIGTWMEQIAMSWLVYRLTDSVFMLGLLGFAAQIPSFIFGPFGGVVSDRYDRHRIVLVTQILSMVQASVVAALVLTDTATVTWLLVLIVFLGIINAFGNTARQAFVIELVEKREDVGNAIALNSSMFNMARLVGPSVAGILIAAVGEGMCFLINALSFLGVIFCLLAMRVERKPRPKTETRVWQSLKEGYQYVFGFPPIRAVIIQIGIISLVGMPFSTLMPVFARDILHGGANTLGYLMGASGIGALTGALYLARRPTVVGLGRVIVVATTMLGFGLIFFSFTRSLWQSLLVVLITGFGMIVQMAASNTILQTISDDDKRGRVMSFYSMAFLGMAPFGSLLAGTAANHIGVPYTLLISGVLSLISIIPFALQLPQLRKMVRPIYERLGILPQIATGVQAATMLTAPTEEK